MPASSHDTKQPNVAHMDEFLDTLWTSEVVPTLPENLEAKAREFHAFQRGWGISCATDLLRALLASVFCGYSFRMFGI